LSHSIRRRRDKKREKKGDVGWPYSQHLLFFSLFFLLGSQGTIRNQMEAGGYPEVPLFAAALFLTACTLALSYHQIPVEGSIRKKQR
jgi:hypothetical protein